MFILPKPTPFLRQSYNKFPKDGGIANYFL